MVGQEIPYLSSVESTDGAPIRTYEFKEVAVRLDVTPHVSEDRMVHLDVHPTVKSVMLQEAIDHFDYLFYFHAGVLSTGTALLVLPGAQGAGKSTLTAGLVAAGMSYYSD